MNPLPVLLSICVYICLFIIAGVLASHPSSRDVHIHNFSLTFHGVELLADTKLELNTGRRYGLVGLNGSGRFTCAYMYILQPYYAQSTYV